MSVSAHVSVCFLYHAFAGLLSVVCWFVCVILIVCSGWWLLLQTRLRRWFSSLRHRIS